MLEKIRVLICDDHPLFIEGLVFALDQFEDIELVGNAGTATEVVAKAQELLPDVILMDLRIPGGDGIEATGQIKELVPNARILMLTASEDEQHLYEAIRKGASGYLIKGSDSEELAQAIRAAAMGGSMISPMLATKLFEEFARSPKPPTPSDSPKVRLTERELQVLELLAKGHRSRDIGGNLGITDHTVKKHIGNILEKLQVQSRMDAVLLALREKILEIE